MSLRIQRRGLVAGAVAAAHLLLLWVLSQYRPMADNVEPRYPVVLVMPINLPPEVRVVPPEPEVRVVPRRVVRREAPLPIEPPAGSSAITLPREAPAGVDWQREAQVVARSLAEPPVEPVRSFDARPKVLVLPENPGYVPKKGDMTPMRPDGSIGLWTTDEIYCEWREPLMNHFEPWARSIPPHCYKRARQRPKPRQEFDLP